MTNRLSKTISSLCVASMMFQPLAAIADGQTQARSIVTAQNNAQDAQDNKAKQREKAAARKQRQEKAAGDRKAAAQKERRQKAAETRKAADKDKKPKANAQQRNRNDSPEARKQAKDAAATRKRQREAREAREQGQKNQAAQQERRQKQNERKNAERANERKQAGPAKANDRAKAVEDERARPKAQQPAQRKAAERAQNRAANRPAAAKRRANELPADPGKPPRNPRPSAAQAADRDNPQRAARGDAAPARLQAKNKDRPAAAVSRGARPSRDERPVRVEERDVRRSNQDHRDYDRDRDRRRDGRDDRDGRYGRDGDRRRDDDRYWDGDRWRDNDRYWDGDRWRYRGRDDDSGLSDLQKFGLVALGAVAVGAIIYGSQTVVSNSGDRVVTRDASGRYDVYRDDNALIRRPGSTVYTDPYDDGSVESRVVRQDGTVIITVLDADGRVLRRSVQRPDAQQVVLYDDTQPVREVMPAALPPRSPVAISYDDQTSADLLYATFETEPEEAARQRFNLSQVRDIAGVRYLAPEVALASLVFASGSDAVSLDAAARLATLGDVMADMIARDPYEVFLIEGHTDATGGEAANLLLSDQRAESVALALTENFGVPPENMVIQGYGEYDLKEQTRGASEVNRQVIIRRVTPLLAPPTE